MDLREVAAAYQSIYLKEEVEETILLEDLSQDEVDDLVEEIIDEFLEEGFSLEQIEEGFEDYISEKSEVLNEERPAKKARKNAKSYDEVKAEIDKRDAEKEKKASRKQKVEDSKKAAKVLKPSEKLANASKKAVEKRKDKTGTTSGAGAQGTVRSKGGSVGAEGEKGTALPPGKKGGAMIKRDTKSVSGMETGPKAEVKSGVRKAMTYRGVGGGKKVEIAGAKRRNMSDVVASAERKAASPKEKVKRAAKETAEKAKSSVKSAGKTAKDAVKSGVKKARNFVGGALGKLADKVKSEGVELDSFDTVVAYLIDEGIASDFDEATEKMIKLSEATVAKIHESQMKELEELYKGKHGQTDKQYADSRSSGGKMVSGDSKMSGAEYTHGRRVKAANPGMQPDVGGKTKPKSQGKMDKGTRTDLEYRKANLKKKSAMEGVQTAYEAVYGGGKKEEKKDTRMTVTNADKKANTPAYQNYMKGDKRYKAADHMKGDK